MNVDLVRAQFPLLTQRVHGKPLVYFDNAATTQKPQAVLDRLDRYYATENANIHRAVHALSELATRHFEEARETVARFINARSSREVIFTKGCTESINLVASSWGRKNIGAGDEIILTGMEHHSNIVPWQMLAAQTGAVIKVAPINDEGELLLPEFEALFSSRTKLLSCVHVSNALGTINPIREMIRTAHGHGVPVLVDGAQSAPHFDVDVQDLDCDFFAFSSHKTYGPTGFGVLYGKEQLLEAMPPYQGGGDMISRVTWEGFSPNVLPYKFEAGTPDMSGAVGLAAALDWIAEVGIAAIAHQEAVVLQAATQAIVDIPGLRVIGTAKHKASVLSFVVEGVHPNDMGALLDTRGIAIRTGHHCAQPLMDRFGIPATARASFAAYNTVEEAEFFGEALRGVVKRLT